MGTGVLNEKISPFPVGIWPRIVLWIKQEAPGARARGGHPEFGRKTRASWT